MRKALLWIGFICGTGLILLIFLGAWFYHAPPPDAGMRESGMQFLVGLNDHPELATELKTKSIDELVQMGILPAAAGRYLHERKAKYFGYDPAAEAATAPLFEMMYRASDGAQKRITTYADGHVTMLPVAPEKGSP